MLLDSCRKLHQFYTEVVHVMNSLESLGKPYRGEHHKEYYFDRLKFYQDILNASSLKRRIHSPRIINDIKNFGDSKRILELNKSDLNVFSTLGNVGGPHFNKGMSAKKLPLLY